MWEKENHWERLKGWRIWGKISFPHTHNIYKLYTFRHLCKLWQTAVLWTIMYFVFVLYISPSEKSMNVGSGC